MYQRILIPVDVSKTSARAVQAAMPLMSSATIVRLVYVVEDVYPLDAEAIAYIDYAALQTAARHAGERALREAAVQLSELGAQVETALLESKGEGVAGVIDAEADRWGADLIVLGTHGRTGLSRLLLGSIAENVVRGSPVPVLMVRTA